MIKTIIYDFKSLDKLTKSIIKKGLFFSFILTIISIIILITYNLFSTYPTIFSLGITLFRLSLTFAVEFIICGFVVDKIKTGVL